MSKDIDDLFDDSKGDPIMDAPDFENVRSLHPRYNRVAQTCVTAGEQRGATGYCNVAVSAVECLPL